MLIQLFKVVYFYLQLGITHHFYEFQHVSWLLCACKFTAWSRM